MPLEIIYQTTISQRELIAIENAHRSAIRDLEKLIYHHEQEGHQELVARYRAERTERRERLHHLDQLEPVD